ncbi:hypothetical protein QJ857_gp0825 [Tupanvirus soda lake]|uniref:Uncharacterized protein n=2 Tax=Tupanvirus TaxID=2094720 RepID=A0A6N1NKL7_9VIRU|nr:hypothetical protein QJ857_gp0825 [Tupanvirus soda lake]QKU35224.1 hypothetical protein [Tupanvirus soda lake]
MTHIMNHIICSVCSRARKTKTFCNMENNYNICNNCKRKNKRFKESYGIEKLTCSCCQKEKDISAFSSSYRRKIGRHIFEKTCRACKTNQMVSEYSTLIEYSKIMLDRLKYVIKKYRNNYPSIFIDLDLSLTDIMNIYSAQNGLCSISNKILTHVYCESSQQMLYLYPSNMTLYLKDITKGYEKDNVSLVCISENHDQLQNVVNQHIKYQVERTKISELFSQLEKQFGNFSYVFNAQLCTDENEIKPVDIDNNIPLLPTSSSEQPVIPEPQTVYDIMPDPFSGYNNSYFQHNTLAEEVPQVMYDLTTGSQISNDTDQTNTTSLGFSNFDVNQTFTQEQLDFLNSLLNFDTGSQNNVVM